GMAAAEQHPQPVVLQRGALQLELEVVAHGFGEAVQVLADDPLVAPAVERPAPRGRGQPGARPVRDAAPLPLDLRGEREVAVQAARDRRQDRGALVAVGPLERLGQLASSKWTIGRMSTEPYP